MPGRVLRSTIKLVWNQRWKMQAKLIKKRLMMIKQTGKPKIIQNKITGVLEGCCFRFTSDENEGKQKGNKGNHFFNFLGYLSGTKKLSIFIRSQWPQTVTLNVVTLTGASQRWKTLCDFFVFCWGNHYQNHIHQVDVFNRKQWICVTKNIFEVSDSCSTHSRTIWSIFRACFQFFLKKIKNFMFLLSHLLSCCFTRL